MSSGTAAYQEILNRLKQREDILRILIFTVFTAFCWVGFSIFLSQKKTKIAPEVQKYAVPLNPNIDRTAIDDILERKTFLDSELENFPIVTPPDTSLTPKPLATPRSATPSATPVTSSLPTTQ